MELEPVEIPAHFPLNHIGLYALKEPRQLLNYCLVGVFGFDDDGQFFPALIDEVANVEEEEDKEEGEDGCISLQYLQTYR